MGESKLQQDGNTAHSSEILPHTIINRRFTFGQIEILTLALIFVLVLTPAAIAQPRKVYVRLTDEAVQTAIEKAVKFLHSRQSPQGALPNRYSAEYITGGESLAAYALLMAGQSPDEPHLKKLLEYIKARRLGYVYTRSLRTIVFSHVPREEYRKYLLQDVQWLIKYQHRNGGWGYGPASAMSRFNPQWTDASNTQFALLALREAADANVPIPPAVWLKAQRYWRTFQNNDGGWGYQPPIAGKPGQRAASYGSMTAAGAVSCLLIADEITRSLEWSDPRVNLANRSLINQAQRAINWLNINYQIERIPKYIWMSMPGQIYYYLFCLERMCESAGIDKLANQDCHAQICKLLLSSQKANGSWNDSIIDTSLAILTLAKGSSPIVINRVELSPDRMGKRSLLPRDAFNIVRWLSRKWGKIVSWQAIPINSIRKLPNTSLLYIHEPQNPPLPKELEGNLWNFTQRGGVCLIQASGEKGRAADALADYLLKLMPDYHKEILTPDHPLLTVRYNLQSQPIPKIICIGDRCRTRIFIASDDISRFWAKGANSNTEPYFQLAANLILYAGGGKLTPPRFARRKWFPPPPPPKKFIKIARLKYGGDYNVCPAAIRNVSAVLGHSLNVALKRIPPVDPDKPIDPTITVLWLTGNVPPKFTERQLANLRKYIIAGGTLFIDPAIGRREFYQAARDVIQHLFPNNQLIQLPAENPIITGEFAGGIGADLRKVRLIKPGMKDPPIPAPVKLDAVFLGERAAVILSQFGITMSCQADPCYENYGYLPDDARKIALNVTLYAATRKR